MLKTVLRGVTRPVARVLYRPTVTGRENVPRQGPVLFASNHLSFIDSVVITLIAPRDVRFLAKSEYFTGTGAKGRVSKGFFESIGAIPVDRESNTAAQDSLERGREVLEAGGAFAIYPEGTRSRDGRLYKGRTGVAWLALTTGSPIVPVALTGTEELLPVDAKVPRIRPVTIRFGEPIDPTSYGEAGAARSRRRLTDDVMLAIGEMSGQERANAYNEPPAASVVERVRRVLHRNDPS
ncbi:1-acyl-sn-glycerol-3-phosphate acyltransferase [Herbiconiux sp. CPCC 203407]|uniref:1-acyl-sn-glycerol-3-phosphate acyltransferase n=1 Tax=Herbiconiux oxytropis TaxID=2970915 RepID=A0AA41XJ87_9MICO|nr:lysophospholipid acyltransferase family protein [Herbiconiux oxytropis]MCS5722294.1 1-acyl-sn-glycerol-3-phosphate acyltransferase [Herbiconiux oxytropis]MCS5727068.1 1-acyl-sn-glycerol-3-phosphate acyltransferase [Herbiconiux oxytropis]